jgi:hypothetical protein
VAPPATLGSVSIARPQPSDPARSAARHPGRFRQARRNECTWFALGPPSLRSELGVVTHRECAAHGRPTARSISKKRVSSRPLNATTTASPLPDTALSVSSSGPTLSPSPPAWTLRSRKKRERGASWCNMVYRVASQDQTPRPLEGSLARVLRGRRVQPAPPHHVDGGTRMIRSADAGSAIRGFGIQDRRLRIRDQGLASAIARISAGS